MAHIVSENVCRNESYHNLTDMHRALVGHQGLYALPLAHAPSAGAVAL